MGNPQGGRANGSNSQLKESLGSEISARKARLQHAAARGPFLQSTIHLLFGRERGSAFEFNDLPAAIGQQLCAELPRFFLLRRQ